MNESTLRTGFVCIATEGKAVDGRDITRDWLVDMAETYDPTYYTAVIWPEHDRWSSYGTVQALKTEEVDGKLKLFAVLCPNRDLVYWNQSGQYQFCSIEPFEQFADLGRTYLIGLGVTDQPASTGTTHLKFSKSNKGQTIGTSEPLDLSMFKLPKHEKPDSLLSKLFNLLSSHGEHEPQPTPSQSEDEEMKPEQFDQMLGALTGLGTKIDAFSAKLETKPTTEQPTVPVTDPVKVDELPGITTEQFNQLQTQLSELTAKIDQFSVEVPGQRPGALGGDDTPTAY
ncbi:GPO family capsid scaffolding protein [Aeromonas salmonicida]|uniref:GPO family capsid scaffolding protein n=1 Tax=Aeromonas salmonicida TaxID=645 RepID=UPI00073CE435|nr:GPO family capsid scaffolding protein [Aeromonas salmonicida]EKP0277975.1 GPO family capsid scaffolding protein [Aeromonas bestiarum]KTA82143.1 capsid protein [Aeromonas salmonicida]MDE7527359.1 GPO family capsid scaffolding protein [Aeromonas salmonicida]MDE7531644.1 GPO family capsid scaffolding protein [Aeromonas salmonicida]